MLDAKKQNECTQLLEENEINKPQEPLIKSIENSQSSEIDSELLSKIIECADKGCSLTYRAKDGKPFEYENKKLEHINVLFSEILNICYS